MNSDLFSLEGAPNGLVITARFIHEVMNWGADWRTLVL